MAATRFRLPPKGTFTPNSDDDPLDYYYIPVVGQLYVSRIQMTLKLLDRPYFPKTLEIGYGSGVLLPTLCQISEKVYGVDLGSDPDQVSKHLSQLGCQAELDRGVPDHLLFADNFFDLVVAISVLEHIKAIKPFLQEIHRVLKPGGVLLVGMPAVNKFMDYLFQAIGFSGIEAHHVTTPEEMQKAALGFELHSTARMPSFLPPSIYLYKSFCFEKIV